MKKYDGYNGQITVDDDALVIMREGLVARASFGKGIAARRIPLQAVSGVVLQEATRLKNGRLSLGLAGNEAPTLSAGTAGSNGDTVMFTHKQREEFQQLYDWLRAVVASNVASGIDPSVVAFDEGSGQVGRFDQKVSRLDSIGDRAAAKQQDKQAQAEAAGMRPDIAAAVSRMAWKLGGGREIKKLPEHLHDAETVEFIAQGKYADNQGIVVMTNARLLFVFHGLTRQIVEDFPYRSISSVQSKAGLATGDLTVHASGNDAVISQIIKPDLKFLADALRQRLGGGPTPPPSTGAAQPDVMDQLRKLAELRDAGVVTPEEFGAKKAELLARL